jgi:hypothetical protein
MDEWLKGFLEELSYWAVIRAIVWAYRNRRKAVPASGYSKHIRVTITDSIGFSDSVNSQVH